jgi:hypothetical protein
VACLAALAVLFLGCDRLRDVKRCRVLAREVNTSFDAIEKEAARDPKAVSYDAIARQYETLGKNLAGFDGGTPELERAVGELGTLARNAARQATALHDAKKADNQATASVHTHELERLARHEKSLAARIDDECRAR